MIVTTVRIVLECLGVLYVLMLFGVNAADIKNFVLWCAVHLRKFVLGTVNLLEAAAEKRRHQRELDLLELKQRLLQLKANSVEA